IVTEVLLRPKGPLIERLFSGTVLRGGGGRQQLDDHIGITSPFLPNRPVATHRQARHAIDEEEVGAAVIAIARLLFTEVDQQFTAPPIRMPPQLATNGKRGRRPADGEEPSAGQGPHLSCERNLVVDGQFLRFSTSATERGNQTSKRAPSPGWLQTSTRPP